MNCSLEVKLSTFTHHADTCYKVNDAIDMFETASASEANDHQISNSDSFVQELHTIFADKAIEDLQLPAAQSSNIDGAVDIVLDQQMELSPMASDPTHQMRSHVQAMAHIKNCWCILKP